MTTGSRLIVESGWMLAPGGTVIADAAVVIEDGRITAIEPVAKVGNVDVRERLGGPDSFALPGLVNAHQHGRPDDTTALGIMDAPLECWLVDLLASPTEAPYPRTLRHTSRLAACGITTVVHMHSSYPPTAEAYDDELRAVLSGYRDGGIRVVLAAGLRDRGTPVYGDTQRFWDGIPARIQERSASALPVMPPTAAIFDVIDGVRQDISMGLFGDAQIAYGPAGPPWCSDELLTATAAAADASNARVHTHLLETRSEQRFASQDGGAVAGLRRVGLMGDRLFIAHGVWLDAPSRDALAQAGVSVVTNPSSNLRLHAGVAPVRELVEAGVNVAVGTDNMTLGGGDEILQDARLMRALQRRPDADDQGLDAAAVLAMASHNGGVAIGRTDVGVLQTGAVGDVVVIDLEDARGAIAAGVNPLELVLSTARPENIRAVVSGGRVIVRDGAPTIVSPPRSLEWPHAEARERVADLMPYVRRHYSGEA